MRQATRRPRGRGSVETTLLWWPPPRNKWEKHLEKQIMRYIVDQFDIDFDTLAQAAHAAQPKRGGNFMTSLGQRLREEGRTVGIAEGRITGLAEGRTEGRITALTESLTRLLQSRFGPLPPPARSRIAAASPTELENWLDQVLDAPSLEAIFGDAPRN